MILAAGIMTLSSCFILSVMNLAHVQSIIFQLDNQFQLKKKKQNFKFEDFNEGSSTIISIFTYDNSYRRRRGSESYDRNDHKYS